MEEHDMQVDSLAAMLLSKNNLREDSASTPTMSGLMKETGAELYFSTGESTTNVVEASTTPRQRPDMPGMESLSGSHQKTPKLSNMRHLLGPLTEDFASPPSLVRPTPKPQTDQRPEAPRKFVVSDSSSSSSNNADSKIVSGDPSDCSLKMVNENLEHTATATSAKKPQMGKTPGTEQTKVVKQLMEHDQENKYPPHAIRQLRERPKRQSSFEFPVLGIQQAPGSGGVIWNLDTPVEQSDQLQTANMSPPHVSIPDRSGGMAPASSSFHAHPWKSSMVHQSLPTASPYAPSFSHGYEGPMRSSLQPQTAEQYQGVNMGVFMGSPAFAPGTEYFQSYSRAQDEMYAHHSPYNMPQAHMQDKRFFYQHSHDMHMMHPAQMPASMAEASSFWHHMPSQRDLTPSFAEYASQYAGAGYIPVMRGGIPYMRNGRPVRIPLEDNTNIFEGQDIKKVATICHIKASKRHMPAKADKQAVKKLVQQQIEEEKPLRAPWYRDGSRPTGRNPDVSWRKQDYTSQQNNKGWRKEGWRKAASGSDPAETHTNGHGMAEGTGCFIPAVGRKGPKPKGDDCWAPRTAEGSSAGQEKQQNPAVLSNNAAATQDQADPVMIRLVAGGRGMAVGTGCFIPSV